MKLNMEEYAMISKETKVRGKFINRELSWIQFNKRVLSCAFRKDNPMNERLNFLGITDSNLDEFISVRFSNAYHHKNEETYYIISGEGMLKTPEGERKVKTGDLLFFPANADGVHKLTNTSQTEMLVYIDFDTNNDVDVAVYPDSHKIGVWGKGVNKVYNEDDYVDYYEGE